MDDFIGYVLTTFIMFALMLGSIAACISGWAYIVDRPACEKYGLLSNQQTYWGLGTGCIVKRADKWVTFRADLENTEDINLTTKTK